MEVAPSLSFLHTGWENFVFRQNIYQDVGPRSANIFNEYSLEQRFKPT